MEDFKVKLVKLSNLLSTYHCFGDLVGIELKPTNDIDNLIKQLEPIQAIINEKMKKGEIKSK